MKHCLEIDGADIDDEDIFQDLFHQKDALQINMISERMWIWSPISSLLVYHVLSLELCVYGKFLLIRIIERMIKNLLQDLSL